LYIFLFFINYYLLFMTPRPKNPNVSTNINRNHSSSRPRGKNNRPMPVTRKTLAGVSDKPHMLVRKQVKDFDEGGSGFHTMQSNKEKISGMFGGNLANPNINPHLFVGPKIATKAAENFPDGPIVKVIPLGGTSEVGMNMTVLECGEDIVIIDTGFGFGGGEKFPGVDYVVPDTEYLEQNRHKIRGLIYTHAHLDHIGAAPYIIPKLGSIPIFGMPLTLALLKNRLQEFELTDKLIAKVINMDLPLTLGKFRFQFFRLNHSIPDVIGLCIDTPMGRIVYTTDWKFDNSPYDGKLSDYAKIAKFGDEGVRLLLTDSLGILKPGHQISERVIGETYMKIFKECEGRILVTAFSTAIYAMQFTIDACIRYKRKLALSGRSMLNNFRTAFELGYIKVPKDLMVDFLDATKLPPEKVCILCTGSQGEDMAALGRMARDEHDKIKLQAGDSIIFTSSPIPGNEDSIQDLLSKLSRKGVDVYRNKEFDTYVSGHANHEDIKLLLALTKPDYLQPIHGDHFMLKRVAELGASMGILFDHNLIGENGRITELRSDRVEMTENIVTDKYLLVDGMSVGLVSEVVLMERRQMSSQGVLILTVIINKRKELVAGPEIISRGFVYMKTSTDLLEDIRNLVKKGFAKYNLDPHSKTYFADLRVAIREAVSGFIYQTIEKEPMVIPVVVQI
jgi:ribonuclease J